MLPSVVIKTNKIAKTQILVEQVIRRLKVFRFFSNEVPIYIYIYIYIYGLDWIRIMTLVTDTVLHVYEY